jgi:TRAP-type mannitol/chloroaromatic compound transport system permease large subunit
LPATFMTAVSVTYILLAKIGFSLGYDVSVTVGIVVAVGALGALIRWSFVMRDGR